MVYEQLDTIENIFAISKYVEETPQIVTSKDATHVAVIIQYYHFKLLQNNYLR